MRTIFIHNRSLLAALQFIKVCLTKRLQRYKYYFKLANALILLYQLLHLFSFVCHLCYQGGIIFVKLLQFED